MELVSLSLSLRAINFTNPVEAEYSPVHLPVPKYTSFVFIFTFNSAWVFP